MTDGSRQGWRYHKVDSWTFRLIDNSKGTEILYLSVHPGKNPLRGRGDHREQTRQHDGHQ